MSGQELVGFTLALAVMLLGLIGCLLPAIPSTPLVMLAAIGHRLYFGPSSASWWVLAVMGGITLLSLVIDYLATMVGAKKLGATWKGILGAVIGATAGIFFPFPGLLVGPFAGAVLFELMGGREMKDAAKAGAGAIIGLFVGAVGKFACCLAMIGLFVFSAATNANAPLEAGLPRETEGRAPAAEMFAESAF